MAGFLRGMVEAEVRDVRPLVKMFNRDYELRLSRRGNAPDDHGK